MSDESRAAVCVYFSDFSHFSSMTFPCSWLRKRRDVPPVFTLKGIVDLDEKIDTTHVCKINMKLQSAACLLSLV